MSEIFPADDDAPTVHSCEGEEVVCGMKGNGRPGLVQFGLPSDRRLFLKASLVDQSVQPFPDREPSPLVLSLDGFGPAHRSGPGAGKYLSFSECEEIAGSTRPISESVDSDASASTPIESETDPITLASGSVSECQRAHSLVMRLVAVWVRRDFAENSAHWR